MVEPRVPLPALRGPVTASAAELPIRSAGERGERDNAERAASVQLVAPRHSLLLVLGVQEGVRVARPSG
eukprot:1086701-Prorocentrum_minimum.AAC.1